MAFASRSRVNATTLLDAEMGVEEQGTNAATLRPSFLQRVSSAVPPKPQHPTAWLDGIRGFASFFVFIYHYQHLFHKSFNAGFGSNGGKDDRWLVQLPIIRLVFAGGPMVLVFWVLSGVSLSLKPIKLARSQSWDKFLDTLFSSVFRRGLRLYLPVMFVQLCVLTMTLMGMFNHSAKLHKAWPFGGTNEKMFAVKDTNLEQIKDWTWTMWCFCNPFRPIRPLYDVHLWTIPLEFRNSIVLFATLIGFSKLRPCIRIALTITLCAYCVLINENDVALFIAGMGIAEYILIREEADQQLPSTETKADLPGKQSLRIRIYWGATCLIGLHLLSIPAWYNDKSLGYVTLNQITPSFITSTERTFGSMGAAIFVFTLSGCEILRRPFQTPLAIYLGNISFPLYIVHGAINHTLGLWSVEFFFLFTGSTTFVGYEMGVILGFVPVGVTVVFLADLLMRVVDAPSVRFGRTLQNMWSVPVVRPNQRGVNVR